MKKVCNTCNINKPLSEFYKYKAAKDGLQSKCKDCVEKYNRNYNKINKDSISISQKKYKEKNKKTIDEYMVTYKKQYNQDNKESINENQLKLNMSEGYGVYKLTHLPTQYFYIGEGKIYSRRHKHFSLLKKGDNPYGLLQEHYNKHPNIDEWQFEVIYKFDDYDKETGKELEAFIIEESREKYPTQILNKKS